MNMLNRKLLAIAGLAFIMFTLLALIGLTGCSNTTANSESNETTQRIAQLEAENERLNSVYEIQNLMSKYQYILSGSGGSLTILDLFAQKNPGVSAQIGDWGVYYGIEGVKKCFNIDPSKPREKIPGMMSEHYLCNPVIEIAGDGKTAAGRWMSPGFETMIDPVTGKAHTNWNYNQYACDFVKEDGVWKIWHLSCMLTFSGDYTNGWVEGGDLPKELKATISKNIPTPDNPYTYPRYAPYDPNGKFEFAPPPTPYETYNTEVDWIDPNK
jgi:hypothetical protein